jgi:hypothetical protein
MSLASPSLQTYRAFDSSNTPMGEGEENLVILDQLLKSRPEYLYSASTYPVRGQSITNWTVTHLARTNKTSYQMDVSSPCSDQLFFSAFQQFTFVTKPSGFYLLPEPGTTSYSCLGKRSVAEVRRSRSKWCLFKTFLKYLAYPSGNEIELESFLTDKSTSRRFDQLVRTWLAERDLTASISDIVLHPAYQQIIGMGPEAVPLLLRELERKPDHWFWALKAITRKDPVPPDSRGKLREMTSAWIRWGRENGYVW